jgi:hypothetical protein
MGFLRKGLFVATGGVSGVAGVKANSKKERTAKALEKQNRLLQEQIELQRQVTPMVLDTTASSSQAPAIPKPVSQEWLQVRLNATASTGDTLKVTGNQLSIAKHGGDSESLSADQVASIRLKAATESKNGRLTLFYSKMNKHNRLVKTCKIIYFTPDQQTEFEAVKTHVEQRVGP